jgi:hypothetical protein
MREKLHYTKPKLTRVEVRPTESVLAKCSNSPCVEAEPPIVNSVS